MIDADCVARSLREYVALMLGPPWVIDLERTDVPDEARPAGLIDLGEATPRGVVTAEDSGSYVLVMPITLTLYPALNPPRVAGRTARALATGLGRLIEVGLQDVFLESGRLAAGPMRIPLWDFADVPLVGEPEERVAPEFPVAVAWVESSSTRPIQDPLDAHRWSVVLDMRVSWEVGGRTAPAAPVVVSLSPRPVVG